jgi:hypothetical protein
VKSLIGGGAADRAAIQSLCTKLHARFLIVTCPASYAVLASSGDATIYKSSALRDDEVVSWTGAGDALAAAVIDSMMLATAGKPIDLREPVVAQRMKTGVRDYIKRVARCEGATPGADIRFDTSEGSDGLTWPERLLFRIRHVIIDILAEKVLVSVILVLLALAVTWLEPKIEPQLKRLWSTEAK